MTVIVVIVTTINPYCMQEICEVARNHILVMSIVLLLKDNCKCLE